MTRILLVVTGAVLIFTAYKQREAANLSQFWREMYLVAAEDARYINCVDFDKTYVMCERPKQ